MCVSRGALICATLPPQAPLVVHAVARDLPRLAATALVRKVGQHDLGIILPNLGELERRERAIKLSELTVDLPEEAAATVAASNYSSGKSIHSG